MHAKECHSSLQSTRATLSFRCEAVAAYLMHWGPLPFPPLCSPCPAVQDVTGKEVPKEVDVMNIRKRVFTSWANHVLRRAESRSVLVDLCSDVQSGLVVLELLKVLNRERPIPPYHARPRIKEEMVKNHQIIFDFLQREGVETATIGSKGRVEWVWSVSHRLCIHLRKCLLNETGHAGLHKVDGLS